MGKSNQFNRRRRPITGHRHGDADKSDTRPSVPVPARRESLQHLATSLLLSLSEALPLSAVERSSHTSERGGSFLVSPSLSLSLSRFLSLALDPFRSPFATPAQRGEGLAIKHAYHTAINLSTELGETLVVSSHVSLPLFQIKISPPHPIPLPQPGQLPRCPLLRLMMISHRLREWLRSMINRWSFRTRQR